MYKINDVVIYKRDVCRVVGREKSGFTGEKCYIGYTRNCVAFFLMLKMFLHHKKKFNIL